MMNHEQCCLSPLALLRLQSWLSPRSPRVFTVTPMVSNGLSKHMTYAIGEVWSSGSKPIFSMAQDETRRYFSKKHGATKPTMKDYVRFQNWRPPLEEHRSSRSNRRSPLRHASRVFKRVWPDRTLDTVNGNTSRKKDSAGLGRCSRSSTWSAKALRSTWHCQLSFKATSRI